MSTPTLSSMQVRKIQAHLKAIQEVLAAAPGTETAELPTSPADRFISERLAAAPGARTPVATVYAAYVAWCQERGHEPMGRRRFGVRIDAPRVHSNSVRYIIGLRLI